MSTPPSNAAHLPIAEAARLLGMKSTGGRRWKPCPACKEEKTGSDPRGCVALIDGKTGQGWVCNACKRRGNAVELLAWGLEGEPAPPAGDPRWREDRWRAVLDKAKPLSGSLRSAPSSQSLPQSSRRRRKRKPPALSAEATAALAELRELQAIIDAPPLTFDPPPPRAGALPSPSPSPIEPSTGGAPGVVAPGGEAAADEQLADEQPDPLADLEPVPGMVLLWGQRRMYVSHIEPDTMIWGRRGLVELRPVDGRGLCRVEPLGEIRAMLNRQQLEVLPPVLGLESHPPTQPPREPEAGGGGDLSLLSVPVFDSTGRPAGILPLSESGEVLAAPPPRCFMADHEGRELLSAGQPAALVLTAFQLWREICDSPPVVEDLPVAVLGVSPSALLHSLGALWMSWPAPRPPVFHAGISTEQLSGAFPGAELLPLPSEDRNSWTPNIRPHCSA